VDKSLKIPAREARQGKSFSCCSKQHNQVKQIFHF